MAYAKRYAGGFLDNAGGGTPIDSTFLNAVEAALLKIFGVDASADGQALLWSLANSRYQPALISNANIDPAAAIAKSKLAALNIGDADIAAAAGIASSKLGGNIPASKLQGYPGDATKHLLGDGSWARGAELLWDSTAAGVAFPAASITTPTLSGSFNHLLVIADGMVSATVASTDYLRIRPNSDATAGNYHYQRVFGSNATTTSQEAINGGAMLCGTISAASVSSAFGGSSVVWLPNYTVSGHYHRSLSMGGTTYGTGATGTAQLDITMTDYYGAAPFTTLQFVTNSGSNFTAGRFSVYGI